MPARVKKKGAMNMKSEWRVSLNIINGEKKYIIYRIKDIHEVDRRGNREYVGEYISDKNMALNLADVLNGKEL